MPDVRERLQVARQIGVPDLWPEVERRAAKSSDRSVDVDSRGSTSWVVAACVVGALVVLGGALWGIAGVGRARSPAAAPLASSAASPGLKTCPFKVGDPVTRDGGGAAVPKPGQGVSGYFDKVDGFTDLSIATSKDGVVTIRWSSSEHPRPAEHVERCRLASP